MANHLNMAEIEAILTLHQQGWSKRKIAKELNIDRGTVRRYLRDVRGRTANAATEPEVLTGSPDAGAAKTPTPAEVLTGSAEVEHATGRSKCEPFRTQIEQKIEAGLSAQRIFQDLRTEHGFDGAYASVQRMVRRLCGRDELPFRRLECEPGTEAQADFGAGAPIIGADGKRRRTHVLRLGLSFSRKAYSEAFFQQTTDNLLSAFENAFRHWGGVPRTLVIDNLRAAVAQADWYDPELHPKIIAFCQHYGTVVLPTKPYTPRHKGKIESGINYVKENALKDRDFLALAEENSHLLRWEQKVADLRIHGTTKKQVRQLFEIEKSALLPLPAERFPSFHEDQRVVHRDGHIEVAKAYYSVPPEYMGHTVWARWDSHLVRILNSRFEQIALHARHELGKFSTAPQHLASRKMAMVERGATELLRRARLIGPQSGRWAEAVLNERAIEGVRVIVGLLSLVKRHSANAVEHACERACAHGAFRLRALRALLKEPLDQEQFEFMAEHPLIRNLNDYGAIVGVEFN